MDLLNKLVQAIIRQEGSLIGTNPGNLRDCPWFPIDGQGIRHYPDGEQVHYITTDSGRFWKPATYAQGMAGLYHVLCLKIAEGMSLRQVIYHWAPPNENDTARYLADMQAWAGIGDADMPLWKWMGPWTMGAGTISETPGASVSLSPQSSALGGESENPSRDD